ncbi:restriction endonuclease subunit S [Acinetobacter sp. NS4_7]
MTAPKLRFKEFSEDYNVSTSQEASIQIIDGDRGNNYPKSDDFYDNEYCLFLNAGNVTKSGFNFENTQFINKEKDALLRKGKLQKNDLVITTRGTVGNIAYFDESIPFENIRINSGMVIARSEVDVEPIYLNQFLKSDLFEKWLEKNVFGSAQPQLTVKLLNSISISYPSKEEQTKIATFLSAVDEKINQLTQKHQLLSQYKQGMMQKLFSQQIRFKADDGSEFGEWDEYSLDTLLSKIIDNRGKTPVTEANLEIPLIEVNAIGQRRIKYEKVSKYFSEDTFQNWFRAYLEHQDILFSTVGNTAICSIYTDEIKAGIAQNIVGLRANTKLIQPTFLYYLLTEISNNQKFKSIEMQAVQPSIKVSQMIHLTFLTPCLEEQTKIANFLSSIDQKIEVTSQQIEQAKQWKKGLLQQMFV